MNKVKVSSNIFNEMEIVGSEENFKNVLLFLKEKLPINKKLSLGMVNIIKENRDYYIESCLVDNVGVYMKSIEMTDLKSKKISKTLTAEAKRVFKETMEIGM